MRGGLPRVFPCNVEIGLLGSTYYVNELVKSNPEEIKAHKVNIDTDMIASANFVRGIWAADNMNDGILKTKISNLHNMIAKYFHSKGLSTKRFEFNGRSDFQPFLDQGIPAGGVITGEDEIKTIEDAELFGGVAGMVLDRNNT